uniref:(California timema) hypothetical protein n=1 Tax=Timema californicum TaxID=61474 RepID=A0A7R9JLT7_TIMCA|nr:unnamed protein product [Timema californicum]
MNITYDPDEFSFTMAMTFNGRVLYQNTMSGKNPRPVCVPLPRLQAAKFCVKFSNVYFIGRNLHMCVGLEARWQDNVLFDHSFDCLRVGADGMAEDANATGRNRGRDAKYDGK